MTNASDNIQMFAALIDRIMGPLQVQVHETERIGKAVENIGIMLHEHLVEFRELKYRVDKLEEWRVIYLNKLDEEGRAVRNYRIQTRITLLTVIISPIILYLLQHWWESLK